MRSRASQLDEVIARILTAARIPGAAIAVVQGGRMLLARGYGSSDLEGVKPVTSQTVYPIGSTAKAINATLLGQLVDEGRLAWDAPVQDYVDGLRFRDPQLGAQVTIRDLITMRTGLPRHDWVWMHNPISRPELLQRLRHLDLTAGFRDRFQYNNITPTLAGHVAEVVAGDSWEALVSRRILAPLGMERTSFSVPAGSDIVGSFHEGPDRILQVTQVREDGAIEPAGSGLYSTVEDMARWARFNLGGGVAQDWPLISPATLGEIHSPQVAAGDDPAAPSNSAAYAMGWFVDFWAGARRISHSGYYRDVNSDVSMFPEEGLALVAFTSFGAPIPARLLNQEAFKVVTGRSGPDELAERLEHYESRLAEERRRIATAPRVRETFLSHALETYVGIYADAGYGELETALEGGQLVLRRNRLRVRLAHWHFDCWVDDEPTSPLRPPHPFDRANPVQFERGPDGGVVAVRVRFEASLPPIRFARVSGADR